MLLRCCFWPALLAVPRPCVISISMTLGSCPDLAGWQHDGPIGWLLERMSHLMADALNNNMMKSQTVSVWLRVMWLMQDVRLTGVKVFGFRWSYIRKECYYLSYLLRFIMVFHLYEKACNMCLLLFTTHRIVPKWFQIADESFSDF